jgi:O-antigen/teichoic acid export membrane protein
MLGGIAGGTLLSQIVLVSAPLVVAVKSALPSDVTAIFATTALSRAPYLVSLGLGLQGTALLSRKYVEDPGGVRRLGLRIAGGGAIAAIAGGAVFGVLAPTIVPVLFGPGTSLTRIESFYVGAASLFAVVSLFLSLILVVQKRTLAITLAWIVAVVAGIAALALRNGDATLSTVISFFTAEIVALFLLAVVVGRDRPSAQSGELLS